MWDPNFDVSALSERGLRLRILIAFMATQYSSNPLIREESEPVFTKTLEVWQQKYGHLYNWEPPQSGDSQDCE